MLHDFMAVKTIDTCLPEHYNESAKNSYVYNFLGHNDV